MGIDLGLVQGQFRLFSPELGRLPGLGLPVEFGEQSYCDAERTDYDKKEPDGLPVDVGFSRNAERSGSRPVSPGKFRTMPVPLVAGKEIRDQYARQKDEEGRYGTFAALETKGNTEQAVYEIYRIEPQYQAQYERGILHEPAFDGQQQDQQRHQDQGEKEVDEKGQFLVPHGWIGWRVSVDSEDLSRMETKVVKCQIKNICSVWCSPLFSVVGHRISADADIFGIKVVSS